MFSSRGGGGGGGGDFGGPDAKRMRNDGGFGNNDMSSNALNDMLSRLGGGNAQSGSNPSNISQQFGGGGGGRFMNDNNPNNNSNSSNNPVGGGMTGGGGGGMSGPGMAGANRPSKVVLIKNVPDSASEADLIDAFGQFGPINYVLIHNRGTAMCEFETIKSADSCVNYCTNTDIFVAQTAVYCSYSPLDVIPRRGMESERPSRVLVMTVQKPNYPITTDVISAICKPISPMHQLKILKKNGGVTVLAEFGDSEGARLVKQRLNGCDIYSGCCSLKIEYAKISKLNVTANNQEQFDYMGPPGRGGNGGESGGNRPGLLSNANQGGGNEIGYDDLGRPIYDEPDPYNPPNHPPEIQQQPPPPQQQQQQGGSFPPPNNPPFGNNQGGGNFGNQGGNFGNNGGNYGGNNMGGGGNGNFQGGPMPNDQFGNNGNNNYGNSGNPNGNGGNAASNIPNNGKGDGTGFNLEGGVLMIYGVGGDKWNCDKIFNLLCPYGNVVRVKYLKTKEDSCMVQMGDRVAAERAAYNLRGRECFGRQLQLTPSNKPYLEEMRARPFELPDGTDSYVDFTSSRNNRFMTPDTAFKNRIKVPSSSVYFWNAPKDLNEDVLKSIAKELKLREPVSIKVLEARESSRTTAGTISFENEEACLEFLITANHYAIESSSLSSGSKVPYVFRMSYSGPMSDYEPMGSSMDGGGRGGGGFRGGRGGDGGHRGRGGGDGFFGGRGGGGRGRGNGGGGDRGGFRGGRGGRGGGSFNHDRNGPDQGGRGGRGGRGGGRGDFRGGRGGGFRGDRGGRGGRGGRF